MPMGEAMRGEAGAGSAGAAPRGSSAASAGSRVASEGSPSSLVGLAYEAVREEILAGRLRPGDRVTVRPFTERLRISPTPLKAALAVLEREGFLVSRPNAGYFVAELSLRDMLDIYQLRAITDATAARGLAAVPERAVLDRLRELLDRQRHAVAADDLELYAALDRAFHGLIWEGCGNRRLGSIAGLLAAQAELGRHLTAQVPRRPSASLEEHRVILAALEAGDPEAAERAARAHVHQATAALAAVLGGA
ncbi:MAG: FCD domain-containing protein [Streptosporangiales bacterium]|nr:FCD domain-containing protein [Streptosporangiales bacterium]